MKAKYEHFRQHNKQRVFGINTPLLKEIKNNYFLGRKKTNTEEYRKVRRAKIKKKKLTTWVYLINLFNNFSGIITMCRLCFMCLEYNTDNHHNKNFLPSWGLDSSEFPNKYWLPKEMMIMSRLWIRNKRWLKYRETGIKSSKYLHCSEGEYRYS